MTPPQTVWANLKKSSRWWKHAGSPRETASEKLMPPLAEKPGRLTKKTVRVTDGGSCPRVTQIETPRVRRLFSYLHAGKSWTGFRIGNRAAVGGRYVPQKSGLPVKVAPRVGGSMTTREGVEISKRFKS